MSKEATARSAMKLALEALELNNSEWKYLADSGDSGYWKAEDQGHYQLTNEAITALREALTSVPDWVSEAKEQPAQPDNTCNNALRIQGKAYPRTCKKCGLGPCVELAQQALDKKAENARELGLDYEPVWNNLPSNKDVEDAMRLKRLSRLAEQPAPATELREQEPVVWMYVNKSTHETKFQKHMRDFVDHSLWSEVPLYGEPLANHELQCVCGAVWCGDEMVHLPDKHPPTSTARAADVGPKAKIVEQCWRQANSERSGQRLRISHRSGPRHQGEHMNKPCEYCGCDLPLGVDKKTRQQRSHHFATCKARPVPEVEPFAQRTWVGLSDEQWQKIANTLGCFITRSQKEIIEAALGIKEKNT